MRVCGHLTSLAALSRLQVNTPATGTVRAVVPSTEQNTSHNDNAKCLPVPNLRQIEDLRAGHVPQPAKNSRDRKNSQNDKTNECECHFIRPLLFSTSINFSKKEFAHPHATSLI